MTNLPTPPEPPPPLPYAGRPEFTIRPNHPKATLAVALGAGGLVGTFLCLLPVLLCPFAWAVGHQARREIEESDGEYDGETMALVGMICGIVGTGLLALLLLVTVGFGLLLVTVYHEGG